MDARKQRIEALYGWAKTKKATPEQIEAEAISRFGLSRRLAHEYAWVIQNALDR